MGKLYYKDELILPNIKIAKTTLQISKGLMFAGKKKVNKGMCLVMPTKEDVKFGASVTMMFCFVRMDIIFVNSNFEIVDKKTLKPWTPNYTPKKCCKYVIESGEGVFRDLRIGDRVKIEFG